MTAKQVNHWEKLRKRLVAATSSIGAKAALAEDFQVSRATVTQWLSGANAPNAANALALNDWADKSERKQPKQKAPGSVRGASRGKARKRQSSYERPKSNQKNNKHKGSAKTRRK